MQLYICYNSVYLQHENSKLKLYILMAGLTHQLIFLVVQRFSLSDWKFSAQI